jgi:hypothetical protein
MYPVIRPVVDLSDVVSSGKQIPGLLGNGGLNLSSSLSRVMGMVPTIPNTAIQNGSADGTNPVSPGISLVQINNSPKSLDHLEIYRNTKNQLEMVKGLVRQT